jgi:hypothetical protein
MKIPRKMLKLTSISMLTGLVALLAGIYLTHVVPDTAAQHPAVKWNAATARVEIGTGARTDQNLRLQLSASGRGIIALPVTRTPASAFTFLHLGFTHAPRDISILMLWRTAQTGAQIHDYELQKNPGTSLWLDTKKLKRWSGDITSLGVVVMGRPGAAVTFKDISLLPASLPAQLKSIYADWTNFIPWQHSSINTYSGLGPTGSTFYPLAVIAALLGLSVLAYLLILLLPWTKSSFDWRTVAAMFLACWIGLDLIWQHKLFRQLALTYSTFYGRDNQGKLAVGIDGELVEFMTEVKRELDSPDSRIFVSSSDDYLRMRGAYYLYPFNVFWMRKGPELPQNKYVHSGDYIVVVEPADTSFDAVTGKLLPQHGTSLSVEPILSQRMGSLYRVK